MDISTICGCALYELQVDSFVFGSLIVHQSLNNQLGAPTPPLLCLWLTQRLPIVMVNLKVIEKRNARERNRVRAVNEAFCRLRKNIPGLSTRSKRVSKVKIIQRAIQYIRTLSNLAREPKSDCFVSILHHLIQFSNYELKSSSLDPLVDQL